MQKYLVQMVREQSAGLFWNKLREKNLVVVLPVWPLVE